MKRFESLSGVEVRQDGREVKMTLNAEHMKPVEIAVSAEMLEALTVQLLQLSVACAEKQQLRPAVAVGDQVQPWPTHVDNFGVMPSGTPGESLLVVSLGLYQLGFSMPSESLRKSALGLLQVGQSMAQEPRTVQ